MVKTFNPEKTLTRRERHKMRLKTIFTGVAALLLSACAGKQMRVEVSDTGCSYTVNNEQIIDTHFVSDCLERHDERTDLKILTTAEIERAKIAADIATADANLLAIIADSTSSAQRAAYSLTIQNLLRDSPQIGPTLKKSMERLGITESDLQRNIDEWDNRCVKIDGSTFVCGRPKEP
jgi:hypothetical protein